MPLILVGKRGGIQSFAVVTVSYGKRNARTTFWLKVFGDQQDQPPFP